MDRIGAIQTITIGVILGFQWLINRRTLRITEALRKRIEALEHDRQSLQLQSVLPKAPRLTLKDWPT